MRKEYPLPIRKDWRFTFDMLSNEEAGQLFTHLWDWVNDRSIEPPSLIIDIASTRMKQDIIEDLKSLRIGEYSHLWRGGVSTDDKIDRTCERYKKWRLSVFKRDKYTCQHCGNKGGKLNAHHIKLFCNNKELRFDVDNGITLCQSCHNKVHKKNKKYGWLD